MSPQRQRLPVERLRLLIPARIRQKVGEAAEGRAGLGRPLTVLAAGKIQQVSEMAQSGRVLSGAPRVSSSG